MQNGERPLIISEFSHDDKKKHAPSIFIAMSPSPGISFSREIVSRNTLASFLILSMTKLIRASAVIPPGVVPTQPFAIRCRSRPVLAPALLSRELARAA